jgi:hypothetical protein
MFARLFISALALIVASSSTNLLARTQNATPQKQTQTAKSKPKTEEADDEATQRRTVAISLVTTLADEARSFKDQTRRARVQARAGDILWDTDQARSRDLFRRAWDAAETADAEAARLRAEEEKKQTSAGGAVVLRGGPDIRSEVLRIVAKRDVKLGEEFLKILDEANQKRLEDAAADRRRTGPGQDLGSSQRLQLARRLAEEGEVDKAMQFAAPDLIKVNINTIFFLSAVRQKNAQIADAAFASLMARAAQDPLSDANTVSGLSSYVLTPFLYVTFEGDGGSNQLRGGEMTPPPMIPDPIRKGFLQVGFQILMQPLPAPEQDHTTSGRTGKYLVIKRLLPVYDQNAPDLAASLRTQMTALASYVPPDFQRGENAAVSRGIAPDDTESNPEERMQERLKNATTADQRDAIYADYAVAFTQKGDPRGPELVDKIENTELRKQVKAYTDFQMTQLAIRNKDVNEITRLAKNAELTSIQRVWAYTRGAQLVAQSERTRAVELLEAALDESRRISQGDQDRARGLTAVATGFVNLDEVRAWEILNEAVKAANGAENFTGEDSRIVSMLRTRQMVVFANSTAPEFDLLAAFRPLSRSDLFRAIQIAKTFTGEAPRAVATLAIARAVLEKREPATASTNTP